MKTFTNILIFLILPTYLCTAQSIDYSYICPVPGSGNLNPGQNIILKCEDGFDPATISKGHFGISGSLGGPVDFIILFSEDARTVILKPESPYQKGEKVSVYTVEGIRSLSGMQLPPLGFSFSVVSHDRDSLRTRLEELQRVKQEDDADMVESPWAYEAPALDNNLPPDYPAASVYSYGEHDDEYLFINMGCWNAGLPWKNYITILDSYGTPIYYDKSVANRNNFHVMPNGRLAYAKNYLNNNPDEKYYIMDSAYVLIDSVNTGNGYILDSHDMLFLGNGHYLVMSYDPQPVDMSQIIEGGNPNAIVTGLVIQEVDHNQNVFFQWRSWDHFEITDATDDVNLLAQNIDYVHGNAFELDFDGHILLSSRHLDEITKINFNNGNVMWRFGLNSKNNMFAIHDDPVGFTHQHDIRRRSNGNYTIYDNGNLRNPQYSQAVEYHLEQSTLDAYLVWNYDHSQNVYAGSAGSFRTRPNGERIVGWGGNSPLAVTELKADNTPLRDYLLPNFVTSYRAIKAPWQTSLFKTQQELSMGNFAGYDDWKVNKLYVFNRSNKVIKITSVHHHRDEFAVLNAFPVSIFPGSHATLDVAFNPSTEGSYSDRFTLNYDNEGNTRRIARQLKVQGIYSEDTPSVLFDPPHGSTNVNPEVVILIGFDEPVRKVFGGEIEPGDIPEFVDLMEYNFQGDDVPFTASINEEKTEISLFPLQPLSENQQHYVRLKRGFISDYEGNVINLDEECYFTTGIMTSIVEAGTDQAGIFPNPCQGHITVYDPEKRYSQVIVYDPQGRMLREEALGSSGPSVDMKDYRPGLYFLRVLDEETGISKVFKVIKH